MGTTGTYIACRTASLPETMKDWTSYSDVADGWTLRSTRATPPDLDMLRRLEVPALAGRALHDAVAMVQGPALAAVVLDSDVAIVVGAVDGRPSWRWTFNEEAVMPYRPDDDEAAQAAVRRDTVVAAVRWTREAGLGQPDQERLDEMLEEGHVLAEVGLYRMLEHLGVCGPKSKAEYREPAASELAAVQATPKAAPLVFTAAAIDHRSEGWRQFVLENELEAWGEPPALLAEWGRHGDMPHTTLYLASDPPLSLGGSALDSPDQITAGWAGTWVEVPAELGDPAAAAAWTRANVGVQGAPPRSDRDLVIEEVPEFERAGVWSWPFRRVQRPGLGMEVDSYEDLLPRAAEVATWLEEARAGVLDPVLTRSGVPVHTAPMEADDTAEPYGLSLSLYCWSVKGRLRIMPGDDAGWRRLLARLRRGELRQAGIALEPMDGFGRRSRGIQGEMRIEVVLRDQFAGTSGPLPDQSPAQFVVDCHLSPRYGVSMSDLARDLPGLAKQTAGRFDVATGFVAPLHLAGRVGGGLVSDSPYEARVGCYWADRVRLDRVTRGAHWGTLLSHRHLELLGGLDELRATGIFDPVERIETPHGPVVWVQLGRDPFDVDPKRLDRMAQRLAAVMPQPRKRG